MVKYTLTAVVPVAQYANLQPQIQVEAESIEEAEKMVLPYIEEFFNKYSDGDKKIGSAKVVSNKTRKLETDIFGNQIYYDDSLHQYSNALGEIYLSGSRFAEQFEKPFDAKKISDYMVTKHKLKKEDAQKIQDMWSLKALASASYGTAIHAALELYGKYKDISESVQKATHIHDNNSLNRAVELFYKDHPDTNNVLFECLIVDHAKKRAGRIDRLEKDSDGVFVTDFKTNYDIEKSLDKYWIQLSFYAAILEANGMKVKGLKIYHWNDKEWKTLENKVLDIDKVK